MSSTYRVLCLSHDPAITIDEEFRSWGDAESAVRDERIGHDGCDLVIGRYSYPLVEVGCLGGKNDGHGGSYHMTFQRDEAKWLLLMSVAALSGDTAAIEVAEAISARSCWSWQRIHRLRFELSGAS